MRAAERIRARLSKEPFEHGPLTISVGVAAFPMHGDTAASVIGAADAARYEAKGQGRERVQGAPAPSSPGDGKKKASKRTAAAKKRAS